MTNMQLSCALSPSLCLVTSFCDKILCSWTSREISIAQILFVFVLQTFKKFYNPQKKNISISAFIMNTHVAEPMFCKNTTSPIVTGYNVTLSSLFPSTRVEWSLSQGTKSKVGLSWFYSLAMRHCCSRKIKSSWIRAKPHSFTWCKSLGVYLIKGFLL